MNRYKMISLGNFTNQSNINMGNNLTWVRVPHPSLGLYAIYS